MRPPRLVRGGGAPTGVSARRAHSAVDHQPAQHIPGTVTRKTSGQPATGRSVSGSGDGVAVAALPPAVRTVRIAGHQREEAVIAVGLLRLWEMKHFVGQSGPQAPEPVGLTDGTATLRPLRPADAAAHLAGEDDELVKWLNGGAGTAATVRAHALTSDTSGKVTSPKTASGSYATSGSHHRCTD
jgi:hypothetical protein